MVDSSAGVGAEIVVGVGLDGFQEVAVGLVAVDEVLSVSGADGLGTDGSEAAVGGRVAVGDVLLDGRGGSGRLQGVSFVSLESVLLVVDDAGEARLARDVVGDRFLVEYEGSGIVVIIGAGDAVGLYIGAAQAVMGDGDGRGGAVVVGDGAEASSGIIGVGFFEAGGCGTGEKAGGLHRE